MTAAADRLHELFQRLDAASRPGLAKSKPLAKRDLDKQRARQVLCQAITALGPVREAARLIGCSDAYLGEMLKGTREVQEWVFWALPIEGKIAWLETLASLLEADLAAAERVA